MKNKKVVAVSVADARELTNIVRVGNGTVTHVMDYIWIDMDIEVPGELEISSKIEDKVEIFTTKLTFREKCCHAYPLTPAFKVRSADGTEMVIGSSDRPYPVITQSQKLSSGNSDSQLWELTVTYSDRRRIPVIEH